MSFESLASRAVDGPVGAPRAPGSGRDDLAPAPVPSEVGGGTRPAAAHLRSFRLTLEYDGSAYHGWQTQPDLETVQGVLERAIARVFGEAVRVTAAGRTDAGVHALGQVVSFKARSRIPAIKVPRALNAVLPGDVVVYACEEVPERFSARFSARAKLYRYRILNRDAPSAIERRRAWHVHAPLDLERMRRGAAALIGEHDFRAFGRAEPGRPTVRTVHAIDIRAELGGMVVLEVHGDGFLWNMVRAIAGTLVDVGRGALEPERVGELLRQRERTPHIPTAPAHGLYLVRVDYDQPGAPEIEPELATARDEPAGSAPPTRGRAPA